MKTRIKCVRDPFGDVRYAVQYKMWGLFWMTHDSYKDPSDAANVAKCLETKGQEIGKVYTWQELENKLRG